MVEYNVYTVSAGEKGVVRKEWKVNTGSSAEKKEEKDKKKQSKKKGSKLLKSLSKRLSYKKIAKIERPTVVIPEYKEPNVLNQTNKFFQREWEEAKRSLFFK